MNITYGLETITPEMAEKYLEQNAVNRKVSNASVDKYAKDIQSGEFQVNGETIVFDALGRLKDGQHRLLAIIKTGIAVQILVVRGIDPLVNNFDIGKNRSIKDIIDMDGVVNPKINVRPFLSCANFIAQLINNKTITKTDVERWLQKHEKTLLEIRKNIVFKHIKGAVSIERPAILIPIICALEAGANKEKIFRFAKVFQTGFYNNDDETAAIVFRNDVLTQKIVYGSRAERLSALCAADKALYDFVRGYSRIRSYSGTKDRFYTLDISL